MGSGGDKGGLVGQGGGIVGDGIQWEPWEFWFLRRRLGRGVSGGGGGIGSERMVGYRY